MFDIQIAWDRDTAILTGVCVVAGGLLGSYAGGRLGAALGAGLAGATGLGVAGNYPIFITSCCLNPCTTPCVEQVS